MCWWLGFIVGEEYVVNRTNTRHIGKHVVLVYFIGAIPLGKLIIGV